MIEGIKQRPVWRLPVYKDSFFASRKRADDLSLKIFYDGETVFCNVEVDERFSNETGTVFNGVLFGFLDVLIWYAVLIDTGKVAMTRRIDIDYLKPVEPGRHYKAAGRYLATENKDIMAMGWIDDDRGNTCMTVQALFRESKKGSVEEVVRNYDFSDTPDEIKELFFSLGKKHLLNQDTEVRANR